MNQTVWNFIFIGITFGVYIGIALWAKAGSTKEYYTAGGSVSPMANGMATAADWMSAATFISMAGLVVASGYDASRLLMGWTGGFVLLTTLMVPYLRKFGKATVPDFIGDRFYSNGARFVAVICAVFICMTYIMGQMNGVGLVFSRLFDIRLSYGVLIGAGIVFFYAGLGGMKGITYTQVAQYCVMVFAYTIPVIFISIALTGNVIPQLGLIGDYTKGDTAIPLLQKMNQLSEELGITKYTDGSLEKIDIFCITAALMVGTAGLPHVIVRFFTVKSVRAVRKSAYWTLSFIAIIYLTAPTLGVFARTNLIDQLNNVSYKEAPQWFKNWEARELTAWVDKNDDGIMQYGKGQVFIGKTVSLKPETVLGKHGERVVANVITDDPNEIYYHRDIIVMANPEMAQLPKWLVALVMAGCVAAALSTAAGLLLVLSTSISHDLMKKIIKPNITDRQEMRYARLASFGSLLVATYFGINPPASFVAKTVAFAFGLAASSFFPTLLMGIFSKRVNKQGAIAGMVLGISFTLAYIVYFQFIFTAVPGVNVADSYLWGISPEGIGFIGMFINFMTAFVVSSLTTPPPQEVQDMVEEIRTPNNAGAATHG